MFDWASIINKGLQTAWQVAAVTYLMTAGVSEVPGVEIPVDVTPMGYAMSALSGFVLSVLKSSSTSIIRGFLPSLPKWLGGKG